jgi:hypothetical protein
MVEEEVEELRHHLDSNHQFRPEYQGEVSKLLREHGEPIGEDFLGDLVVTRDKKGEHEDAESLRDKLRADQRLTL